MIWHLESGGCRIESVLPRANAEGDVGILWANCSQFDYLRLRGKGPAFSGVCAALQILDSDGVRRVEDLPKWTAYYPAAFSENGENALASANTMTPPPPESRA